MEEGTLPLENFSEAQKRYFGILVEFSHHYRCRRHNTSIPPRSLNPESHQPHPDKKPMIACIAFFPSQKLQAIFTYTH